MSKKINSKCIGDQDCLIRPSRKSVSHLQESVHVYDQSCPTRPSIKLDSRVQFKESGCDQISSLFTMKSETKRDGTKCLSRPSLLHNSHLYEVKSRCDQSSSLIPTRSEPKCDGNEIGQYDQAYCLIHICKKLKEFQSPLIASNLKVINFHLSFLREVNLNAMET